ncbi:hypothetical protein KP509_22G052000 [Ceratopteris richardii]|uniref:RING-type E3 ubiquitin transferase n=1 Tax=Ceratopteris richardii TaxID=49495 RepID=A0A8T2S531_CERRI|nr:hypothetical protein KP509_22G052000 [Ceratopteris richardii]
MAMVRDREADAEILERDRLDSQAQEDPFNRVVDGDEGEEEGDVCRICRTSGDKASPLYYPCACSGSIKYVHQDCLIQWLNLSNARQCEVCKHPFVFSPVYAENAPSRLSFREFLLGLAVKGGRGMHFFLRLAFVLSVWLVFIPFTTFWIWRFTFVRSLSEMQRLFISRMTPTLLFTDCLHGFLLSAGIVFIFLGATSLREYFRHLREVGGHDAVDGDDDVIDRRPGVRGGRRQAQAAPGERLEGGPPAVAPGGVNREVGLGQGLAAGAGLLIRRNAENVAARLEMQAARLEAHVEQMFDGADDVDGAEDVPFDELVGMQGPVFHLLENAFTVLASNAIFLGLVALLPFTLGRIALYIPSHMFHGAPGSNNSFMGALYMSNNITPANITEGETRELSSSVHQGNVSSSTFFGGMKGLSSDDMVASSGSSFEFSDAVTVATGYGIMIALLCAHFGLRFLIKYSRGEPLSAARFQNLASMAEAASTLASQFLAGLKYILTMLKVAFLLLVELGIFPLLCGWWLDICTLSMLGSTVANRLAFFWASPLTSSLLHWLVGIVYMLHTSIVVSLLREVLRPGVLHFLRDPADPNYNPFHDLVEDPIHKHARRVLLSVVVYGSLVVMLIFLPVKIALSIAPSLFPLDIRISDPFTEIPADMLLFHICIPFAIEHFRPKRTIRTVLFYWFSAVGWALGLTEYLLPATEGDGSGQGANQVQELAHVQAANQIQDPANASSDVIAMESDSEDQNDSEYIFAFRIILLLLGAWLSLLVFNSTMLVLPVSLGRGIFSLISSLPIAYGLKCNDLYAFNIGFYVLWATIAAIGYTADYLKTHNAKVLAMQILKWTVIVTKSSMLLSFWIIVIPVLIGLLFELLLVIPLRVPIDESPVFLLYQDWALGLVFLKIWTRLVMLGQVPPIVDDSWRMKFERVKADGFRHLQGLWVMREIVAPILMQLLTALCVPYVVARGLFPVLGYSLFVNSAVYRFAWSGCLLLALLWYGIRYLQRWASELHNSIRDDRYLIGKRLHNFGEKTAAEVVPEDVSPLNQPGIEPGLNSGECSHMPEVLNNAGDINEVLQDGETKSETLDESNWEVGLRRRYQMVGTPSCSMEEPSSNDLIS